MFGLVSDITMGLFKRVKPHEVKVKKSIYEYVDKCTIKLPISARIKRAGEVITETAETAKQFTEGDKVIVKLGYNNIFKVEFEGFVSRINFTSPLEVECEGYSYQLRKQNLKGTYKNIELKDLLKIITAGTDIVLSDNIPSFLITKIILNDKDGCHVLEEIKGTSKQLMRFFFLGKILYAGLTFINPLADVKFKMGWNVIKDGGLKLRQAKNQNYQVIWIGVKSDGTKVTVIEGKSGVIKTHVSHVVTDFESLKKLAVAEHNKLSLDGYEGKITAFGIPFCKPGDKAILTDEKYPERGGNYIVENTEVSYGMSGFRRTIGIGAKL